MNKKRLEVFLEFLIFGIIMGIVEDIIAVLVTTDASLSWNMLGLVTLITIPFALIGEILVDRNPLIKHDEEKKK